MENDHGHEESFLYTQDDLLKTTWVGSRDFVTCWTHVGTWEGLWTLSRRGDSK